MASAIGEKQKDIQSTEQAILPSKGKFQRLCDWMATHKKEVAIALLIIGISALCLGFGLLTAMFVASGWFASAPGLSAFVLHCFSFSNASGMITGLTTTGAVVAFGAVSTIVGLKMSCHGAGMLAALPSKGEA